MSKNVERPFLENTLIWKYFELNIRSDSSCPLPLHCFALLRPCLNVILIKEFNLFYCMVLKRQLKNIEDFKIGTLYYFKWLLRRLLSSKQ